MSNHPLHGDDHEIWKVLPWYANGRLSEADRRRVDAHLLTCVECRSELAAQTKLHEIMSADRGIERLPAAGLQRLRQRIATGHPPAADDAPAAHGRAERRPPWLGLMAASVAVMAVALSIVAGVLWSQAARRVSPAYYTVTTVTPRAADEVIRAVFSSTLTLTELAAVLGDAHLKIVAGPTEAGVYSLSPTSARSTAWSLQQLRGHASVRFAEAIQSASGATPQPTAPPPAQPPPQ